jgi:hypothetical protein
MVTNSLLKQALLQARTSAAKRAADKENSLVKQALLHASTSAAERAADKENREKISSPMLCSPPPAARRNNLLRPMLASRIRLFSPSADKSSSRERKRPANRPTPLFERTPAELQSLPQPRCIAASQDPPKSPLVSSSVNSRSPAGGYITIPQAVGLLPPSPRRTLVTPPAFAGPRDPYQKLIVDTSLDAAPMSISTVLVTPTESNACSWQEMGYPDAQSALRYQQIADPKKPSFERQLLLAQLEHQ